MTPWDMRGERPFGGVSVTAQSRDESAATAFTFGTVRIRRSAGTGAEVGSPE